MSGICEPVKENKVINIVCKVNRMSDKKQDVQKSCTELQAVLDIIGKSYKVIKFPGNGSFSKFLLLKTKVLF